MLHIVVKDESDDEGDKMALISHVRKNDTWIIDSGFSNHMNGDKMNTLNIMMIVV